MNEVSKLMLTNCIAASGLLDLPLKEARLEFERAYASEQLKRSKNMPAFAERCGMERTHLYRKLKDLGLESPFRSHAEATT